MVHVSAIFPIADLEREMEEGWVRRQSHPTLPLYIYNYTEQAQFAKHWNPVTINCRGLILDANYNVVARPWKKFFNYGEGRLAIDDTQPVEVTDKMDGSLGILYWNGTEWDIATRGSFNSDQSWHAKQVWDKKYAKHAHHVPSYTFLFEIVYPENRIVLNYGDMDDLVLLGAVHIERGYYLGPNEAAGVFGWPGPVTQVLPARNMAEAFALPPRENAEGVVVRSGSEMVKIKQVDYVELHRIVTNLSGRRVWERLAAGDTIESLCEWVPDEWHGWLKETASGIIADYQNLSNDVLHEFSKVMGRAIPNDDRKTFALEAVKSPYAKFLFSLYDEKSIIDQLWKEVRPDDPTENHPRKSFVRTESLQL